MKILITILLLSTICLASRQLIYVSKENPARQRYWKVSLQDICDNWLMTKQTDGVLIGDLNNDGIVNMKDLVIYNNERNVRCVNQQVL